ncbi:MAG: glycosyltransferase [Candidatus Helarchaeota archaeon]
MRIGFFTDTYHQINGVTTIIHSLERELYKRGHEVFIFAPRAKGDYIKKKPNLFTSESVRLILNPEYKWALFPIFNIKDTNQLDLDIIHVHSPLSMGLSGLFNGKRLGIPIVGTVHTLIPEFWKDFVVKLLPYITPPILDRIFEPIIRGAEDFFSLFMQHFSWRYFARFFNQCDVVTVPSTYAQELCKKNGIINPIIIPNGVDFSKFQHGEDLYDFHERWDINKDFVVFLTVGRLSEEKNLEILIQAAKNISETFDRVKFLIIGDGQQGTKLKRLTERLKIQDAIIFAGYVKYEELGLCYKSADWLVVTSPHETFGLTLIEAMHFGCPVLGINSGGIIDIIENKKNGLFFDGTVEDLTQKLSLILKNRIKYDRFRQNAIISSKKYEIGNATDKLIKLYEKLLNKK